MEESDHMRLSREEMEKQYPKRKFIYLLSESTVKTNCIKYFRQVSQIELSPAVR